MVVERSDGYFGVVFFFVLCVVIEWGYGWFGYGNGVFFIVIIFWRGEVSMSKLCIKKSCCFVKSIVREVFI